ncbi:MAG: DUF427 domain-containing protein [Solirubrobacterales bacterium]|nr:DUF427 domain-containing protein [Solirubrobacterales bacterium]
MGLSWQQGPLGRHPTGHLFVPDGPTPARLLFIEPLRRRMSVRFAGRRIALSDAVILLHEPARYPVAYFPVPDIDPGALEPGGRMTEHPDLGPTRWFTVRAGGSAAPRGAWRHIDPPAGAQALRETVAFAWRAMDAFLEEDERILGHAADSYHRIDIRASRRHLVVTHAGRFVADTTAPLVLYESGFAPRWYVPRADTNPGALTPVDGQTFCPYKGVASYYDVHGSSRAAWSYPNAYPEVVRIADMVSFEPDRVHIALDGERLHPAPGQAVIAHGIDRDLSPGEARTPAPGRPPWS